MPPEVSTPTPPSPDLQFNDASIFY